MFFFAFLKQGQWAVTFGMDRGVESEFEVNFTSESKKNYENMFYFIWMLLDIDLHDSWEKEYLI